MPDSNGSTGSLNNTDGALAAIRRGFQPIPLETGGKRSLISGWPRLRWENTDEGLEKAREKFDAWSAGDAHTPEHGGLGVLLGDPSNGLVDIDLDHPLTTRLKDHFLPPTKARSGRASRPNSHYWYIAEPGTLQGSRAYKLEDRKTVTVEHRSTGGQTALPGNQHPTGELYEWTGEEWGGDDGPAVVDGRVLAVQVALLGFCTLLVSGWASEGSRHEAYLALAGGLLRVGDGVHPYWERNAGVVIGAIADATGDEDGARTRISEVMGTTLRRLREGKTVAGFGKLANILGEDVVRQARVVLSEIESAAGLPARTSGKLSIEKIAIAVGDSSAGDTAGTLLGETDSDHPDELPDIQRDPLEDRSSSWAPVDLDPYLSGQVQEVVPEVLEREDGQFLMYPGRLNMLYGPSESAKSWIAMFICLQLMERGERVVYLDFEDEPVNALNRMRLIGASLDDLQHNFTYVRPEEPLAKMQRSRWGDDQATDIGRRSEAAFARMLAEVDPSLIVADGMTVLYGLHGLDSNDSVQTDVITSWLKELSRNGRSTVVLVDHTAKNPQRGSLPIGSQHKVSMVQGSLLQAYPIAQPMPGAVGEIELIVLKDRPGKVRAASQKSGEKAQLAARVRMDSTKPGETVMTLEAPAPTSSVTPSSAGAPASVNIDLRMSRDAAKADKEHAENVSVLKLFGNVLGRSLGIRQIAGGLTGAVSLDDVTTADQRFAKKIVDRLMIEDDLEAVGSTKDRQYVLKVTYPDDPTDDDDDDDSDEFSSID